MNKKKTLYEDVSCYFSLANDTPVMFQGFENYSFEDIQNLLADMGVELSVVDKQVLFLKLDQKKYNRVRTRYAGNIKKAAYVSKNQTITYKYYDILYFRYGRNWKWNKIAGFVGLSRATFYRRKKELEESSAYKRFLREFETEKADDLEYYKKFEYLDMTF